LSILLAIKSHVHRFLDITGAMPIVSKVLRSKSYTQGKAIDNVIKNDNI